MPRKNTSNKSQWFHVAKESLERLAIQYQNAQPPFFRWKYNPKEPPLRLWQSIQQALSFAGKDISTLFDMNSGVDHAIEELRRFAFEVEMLTLLRRLERHDNVLFDIHLRSSIKALAAEGRTFLSEVHTSDGERLDEDHLFILHIEAVKAYARHVVDDLQITYAESRKGPIHESDFRRLLAEADIDISHFILKDGTPMTFEKLMELNQARDRQMYQHEMSGPSGIGQDAEDLLTRMEQWAREGLN